MSIYRNCRIAVGKSPARSSHGFTLLELMAAVAMIGILFAIAAPGWSAWLSRQQLNTAQSEALQAIRLAQESAKRKASTWRASFRQHQGVVQWVIHPTGTTPPDALWKSLDPHVRIDTSNTTLQPVGNVWKVEFNYRGRVNGRLGRLTLASKTGSAVRRCVFVSTLLGAMRTSNKCNR